MDLFSNLRGVALTVTPLKVFLLWLFWPRFDPSPHSVTSDPSPADETRYSGYDQHARGDWWCFHICTGASASTSRTRDLEHTHTYSGHLLLRKITGGVIRWSVRSTYPWWIEAWPPAPGRPWGRRQRRGTTGPGTVDDVLRSWLIIRLPPSKPGSSSAGGSAAAPTWRPAAFTHTEKN